MHCPFVADKNDATVKQCPRCGLKIRSAYPPEQCLAACRVPGIGDRVAKWLGAFGVHKRRKCGCNKRQSWLNSVGEKLGW